MKKSKDQNRSIDNKKTIKRDVEILSIKDEKGDINFQYKFEFEFIKEGSKKKAIVFINRTYK